MYFNEEDLYKWGEHINSIVGENSLEGAFIVAEKAKNAEVNLAGENDELLYLMAVTVFNYSKMQKIAFEDAMTAISKKWDEISKEDGYIKTSNEIIDKKTGIGFNPEDQTISFPILPKNVQDEMIAMIESMEADFDNIRNRLKSHDDIMDLLYECEQVGCVLPDNDTDPEGIHFTYKGTIYTYFLNTPDFIFIKNNDRVGNQILEDFEELKDIAVKMIKYTKENKA